MTRIIKISATSAIIAVIILISSCAKKFKHQSEYNITSSLETLSKNKKYFIADTNDNYLFSGGSLQTSIQKRSGNFSVITTPKNAFALSIELPGIKRDSYFEMSIWRKGAEGQLVAVITGTNYYFAAKNPVKIDENGWGKLSLNFYVPPTKEFQKLKVYVWNPGKDSVFFDDISIQIIEKKAFPIFNEDVFHIEMDTSEYIKLIEIRKRAFIAGVLQSTDDDWIKGFAFANNKLMKSDMRLKGDWLDHLHGNKWSFRIKLKKGNTWNNMRVFSVQSPLSRLGVNEWFLHQFMISEDLLTTRYGFMPVTIVGENTGIYAYEEHFTKQLVESQKRREGPIVRFVEDALWDTRVFNTKGKRYNFRTPVFEAATIKPFSTTKTVADSNLFNQFLIAQNLMYQYKNRLASASEIFNTEMLAKYFAIADVFLARHSIIWHNQRFYYNPVLCKLEPISYDCYSDIGLEEVGKRTIYGYLKNNSIATINDEFLMLRELFNDAIFTEQYINYLEKYSSVAFLDSLFICTHDQLNFYDSLIKIEFPEQYFFKNDILENANNIRKDLPKFKKQFLTMKKENLQWLNKSKEKINYDTIIKDFLAHNLISCYKQNTYADSSVYKINNFYPGEIVILGLGKGNKKITEVIVPVPIVSGFSNGTPGTVFFSTEEKELNFLFFSIKDHYDIMAIEIMPWPEPSAKPSPVQQLIDAHPFPDTNIIERVESKNVHIKKGNITINETVIIPLGYRVYFHESTTINMINNAGFISYSPITINGTKENPVTITSSDFSANGFTVLQAGGISHVKNTVFKNLNTLDFMGWTLTGAVNFYESDVEITNTTFYRNQCEDALNIIRSDFILKNSIFDYIYSDAFDSDFSTGKVIDTKFTNTGNDAIDFSGSQILIQGVEINNANDKGISGGENSQLIVENTTITSSGIGLASKDLSVVQADNCTISHCNYGIVLLQKKPEYGPSTLILNNTQLLNSKNRFLIEQGSIVIENNDTIKGTQKNVAELFY